MELLVFQAKNYFLHIFIKITVMTLILWICEVQIVREAEEKFDCFRKCDDTADNKLVFNCDVDL